MRICHRPWKPSSIAQALIAVGAGGCAVWSWVHGDGMAAAGAFGIALVMSIVASSTEERTQVEPEKSK